jgi:hypothetical protein
MAGSNGNPRRRDRARRRCREEGDETNEWGRASVREERDSVEDGSRKPKRKMNFERTLRARGPVERGGGL